MAVTHGLAKSPTYYTWQNMKARCYQKTTFKYELYGGASITVCDRWKNSFENFLEDMGTRPSELYTLDRIDNTKGYYKENCRWVTRSEQMHNLKVHNRKNVGVTKYWKKWKVQISVKNKSVFVGLFDTEDEAIEARKEAEYKYWNRKREELVYGN